MTNCLNLEGLPDYWGIETKKARAPSSLWWQLIWKDYPTTGVLKLSCSAVIPISPYKKSGRITRLLGY